MSLFKDSIRQNSGKSYSNKYIIQEIRKKVQQFKDYRR